MAETASKQTDLNFMIIILNKYPNFQANTDFFCITAT